MARARAERARSKTAIVEDINQSLERLQGFIPQIEDLGRDGFPYLEGARARTELQLKECIRKTFGEKSLEYESYRKRRVSVDTPADTKQTVAFIKSLIASLEDKKLEVQGLKPAPVVTPPTPAPATPPPMTLVPPVAPATPTAQVSIAQHAQPTPPPVTLAVALTTNLDMTKPTAARVIVPATAPSPAVSAAEPIEANPAPVPAQPSPRPVGGAQEAHGAPAAPVVAAPVAAPAPRPAGSPAPAPPPASTSSATIPVEIEAAPSHVAKPAAPLPPSAASRPEPIKPSPASEPAASMPAALPRQSGADAVELVKSICQRFHLVARQLRLRGEYRPTVAVEDECDAQDLLHALLRLHFDDIGTVEWTPADSLGVPRTVFLLNDGRLAVFVKKTRAGLNTRDLSEQLRLDVERCGTLKRCSALLCFVYDPEGRIGNPRGLESDLISVSDQLTVDVYVAPK